MAQLTAQGRRNLWLQMRGFRKALGFPRPRYATPWEEGWLAYWLTQKCGRQPFGPTAKVQPCARNPVADPVFIVSSLFTTTHFLHEVVQVCWLMDDLWAERSYGFTHSP